MNKTVIATRDYDYKHALRSAKDINIPKKYLSADHTYFNNFQNWLLDIDNGKGILIYGNTGTGKTFLGCALLHYYYINTNFLCKFYDCYEIVNNLLDFKKNNVYDEILMHDLIMVDDFGVGEKFERAKLKVEELINVLYSNDKYPILTSNLSPDDIKETYGDRVCRRINDMCTKKVNPTKVYT